MLKFLLAAGGLSVHCAAAMSSGATGTVVGNSVYSGFRQAALVQLTGSGVSSHAQEKKTESLKCAGRNGDGRAGLGEVFCRVPVSPNTQLSLYLLQNHLCLLQIYCEALCNLASDLALSEKRSKRVSSVQNTRKRVHLGIYVQVDFAQRWLMSSFLHGFL